MATLDKLKPDVAENLRVYEASQMSRQQARSMVNTNVKYAAKKKKVKMDKFRSSRSQFIVQTACDLLGDPGFKFHYSVSKDPNDRKYNIKYAKVTTQKPDEEMPIFFKCPPGVILESSMEGLGPETAVTDSILTRKFKLVIAYGVFKLQQIPNPDNPSEMIEVITNEIDPFPIWSKWMADQHYLQNPFDREDDYQRKITWEIQTFYDNMQKIIAQAGDFIINDTDDIIKGTARYSSFDDYAKNKQSEWASKQRQSYLDEVDQFGYSKHYPALEESQWKVTHMGKAKYLKSQVQKLNMDMTLPTDSKMSDNTATLRTVLTNSFLFDFIKTPAGSGKSRIALLQRAYEMADEFIEKNPNLLNRLATIRFERSVWKSPKDLPNADREAQVKAAAAEYDNFKAQIKSENPNLDSREIKKLADEQILPFILEKLKWKHNIPEVRNFHGRPPVEKNHLTKLDSILKPYASLAIGTFVMLTFMNNFSIPKADTMAFGLKLSIIGKIHQSFGASVTHVPTNVERTIKSGMTTEDYENSFADFLTLTEQMKEKGSFDEHMLEEASPGFIQMAETSGLLAEAPVNNYSLGEAKPEDPDYNLKDFEAQNSNGQLDGGDPAPERPKPANSKKRVPVSQLDARNKRQHK